MLWRYLSLVLTFFKNSRRRARSYFLSTRIGTCGQLVHCLRLLAWRYAWLIRPKRTARSRLATMVRGAPLTKVRPTDTPLREELDNLLVINELMNMFMDMCSNYKCRLLLIHPIRGGGFKNLNVLLYLLGLRLYDPRLLEDNTWFCLWNK